jgi:hypothetical protein
MKLERVRPAVFQVTLHAGELGALVSAARWIVEGSEGDLPDEALEQLRQVLSSYDAELARITN